MIKVIIIARLSIAMRTISVSINVDLSKPSTKEIISSPKNIPLVEIIPDNHESVYHSFSTVVSHPQPPYLLSTLSLIKADSCLGTITLCAQIPDKKQPIIGNTNKTCAGEMD